MKYPVLDLVRSARSRLLHFVLYVSRVIIFYACFRHDVGLCAHFLQEGSPRSCGCYKCGTRLTSLVGLRVAPRSARQLKPHIHLNKLCPVERHHSLLLSSASRSKSEFSMVFRGFHPKTARHHARRAAAACMLHTNAYRHSTFCPLTLTCGTFAAASTSRIPDSPPALSSSCCSELAVT
jgi:hypothetical protein